jgi:hypothetical protein
MIVDITCLIIRWIIFWITFAVTLKTHVEYISRRDKRSNATRKKPRPRATFAISLTSYLEYSDGALDHTRQGINS